MLHRKKDAKMKQQNKVAKEEYTKTNWKRSTQKMRQRYLSLAQRHESCKRIHLKGKGIGYLKAGVDSGMSGLKSSVIDTIISRMSRTSTV